MREKQMVFLITSRCTLSCKLCSNMIYRFKEKRIDKDIPLEQVKKEMEEFFHIYDYVEDVTIAGGEPLLHPELLAIISYCLTFEKQFDHLRIFSNGTIIPSEQFMTMLVEHKKLSFTMSDYGPNLSTKAEQIKRLFDQYELPLRIVKYYGEDMHCNGWVDYGDPYIYRNYSAEQVKEMFSNCHVSQYKDLAVYNGKLLNCSWTLLGAELGIFPQDENGAIDLLDDSISLQEKKQIAERFAFKPYYGCQYCDGFLVETSKRYPGGEQVDHL